MNFCLTKSTSDLGATTPPKGVMLKAKQFNFIGCWRQLASASLLHLGDWPGSLPVVDSGAGEAVSGGDHRAVEQVHLRQQWYFLDPDELRWQIVQKSTSGC